MRLKPSKKSVLRCLPGSMVWVTGPGKPHTSYLTFDDGPHAECTPRLLDLLAEHGVKATFFVVGSAVELRPKIVQRIVAEGHVLGNHSWNHPHFSQLSIGEQMAEIDRCDEILANFDGLQKHDFRPPRGELSPKLMWLLWRQGRRVVYWSRDSMDYNKGPADQLTKELACHGISAGDILLMHDDDDCARLMLGELLPLWHSRGMRFEALPMGRHT